MKGVTYTTTKELLISAEIPQITRTYKPVAHEQLIDLTLEGIHQAGFILDKELYSSAKDGQMAHGRFNISNVADTEMQLQIMWQNSYNKMLRLEFCVGAVVLVCTNGMVSFRAMNAFKKKHMGEIQTLAPQKIGEYIKQAGEVFSALQYDRDQMKQVEIDKRVTAELIGRMYIEEQFIESTQLNIIKRELDKPTHDYNSPSSLWELYNHTTFAIGAIHPGRWIEDHMSAHKFFTEISELMNTPKPLITIPVDSIHEDSRVNQLLMFD